MLLPIQNGVKKFSKSEAKKYVSAEDGHAALESVWGISNREYL